MNASKHSLLREWVTRIFGTAVPAAGGYVFNLRGRWRYESHAQRRAHMRTPRSDWTGEAIAHAWLSRQAQGRKLGPNAPKRPDAEILALSRS